MADFQDPGGPSLRFASVRRPPVAGSLLGAIPWILCGRRGRWVESSERNRSDDSRLWLSGLLLRRPINRLAGNGR